MRKLSILALFIALVPQAAYSGAPSSLSDMNSKCGLGISSDKLGAIEGAFAAAQTANQISSIFGNKDMLAGSDVEFDQDPGAACEKAKRWAMLINAVFMNADKFKTKAFAFLDRGKKMLERAKTLAERSQTLISQGNKLITEGNRLTQITGAAGSVKEGTQMIKEGKAMVKEGQQMATEAQSVKTEGESLIQMGEGMND